MKSDKDYIQTLIQTYPSEELTIYPVGKLKGKYGLGDVPEALEKVDYPELKLPVLD